MMCCGCGLIGCVVLCFVFRVALSVGCVWLWLYDVVCVVLCSGVLSLLWYWCWCVCDVVLSFV